MREVNWRVFAAADDNKKVLETKVWGESPKLSWNQKGQIEALQNEIKEQCFLQLSISETSEIPDWVFVVKKLTFDGGLILKDWDFFKDLDIWKH